MFTAEIQTVKHDKQRYDTVGDYWSSPDGVVHFRVSDLGDWRMEFLIAVHELIEYALAVRGGVTVQEIDEFDLAFELNRKSGDMSEPGDDPKAPYHVAHQIATFVEAALAERLGVDWRDYDKKVKEL
jgi:hypothetical protein